MFTIYNCIAYEHDLRLVVLAAIVCALASFAAINFLNHVRKTTGYMRDIWLCVAATASGFGIWATHFIAMLAYSPGIPSGYNIILTTLSLLAAILLTGVGLSIASANRVPAGRWIGGAAVGGGIAAMHYTGMAAFEIAGRIQWDAALVVASIALGAAIGATALPAGLRDGTLKWKAIGAMLLTLAICSHHFTAMGAVSIIPDPAVAVSEMALPAGWLALGVALASLAILFFACGGLALDIRERHRAELEVDRMRGLADASAEGLLVCYGDKIVSINSSLTELTGYVPDDVIGKSLAICLPEESLRHKLVTRPRERIEAELRDVNGQFIPAEFILRTIDFAGQPHHAIAVRDLRDRKKAEEHIQFLAHHDALTGLPNRNSFNARLDHEIEVHQASGRSFAVLCLDLDRFKEVNDLFGHAAGDALLKRVAKCVTAVLDRSQMMARLGGDEFAIIATNLSGASAAGRIAEQIIEALRIENESSTTASFVSTSIGIAIFPNDAQDGRGLLTHADTALYRAKTDGRGVYRFFEAEMGVEVRDRRMLERDLRSAIAHHEFELVYQPQARLDTREITGFEALLRWHHPRRGQVSPGLFIPVAEESGAIQHIGEWVLRQACKEASGWTNPLSVAVNVSAMQLHNPQFTRLVHEIIIQTGLKPGRLELEITETALIRDLNRALATLRQLKALGVRIAMDDFGTGYSSLSNLRAFPFDKIKIDRSFIKSVEANEQAATIVRAVLGIGRGLKLPVLAEGVETREELRFLGAELCDQVQGYLVGRPADIAGFRYLTHAAEGAHDLEFPLPHTGAGVALKVASR
ncbi:EAL domain-containing protein [Bradyrhizobium sp. CB82]|uniref:bifunctional diguanylate cyclase/phosphodiesterase n=1 Tax=Bradyrhizobium sp. CB82 TaxID=3039159 RepID=UPI0024B11C4F|nr:EAL domain-containing protein [Bradyrhizobium sp. CB82]WFU41568.1 EAL domain-containing protein [Bradyrhizobium sp. CB82]